MEVEKDMDDFDGEFIIYLDKNDLEAITNDYIITKSVSFPRDRKTIDFTVSFDDETNIDKTEEEYFDSAMKALEVFYRAYLVSDLDTTVKQLMDNDAMEIQKALNTYRHYREIKNKYE